MAAIAATKSGNRVASTGKTRAMPIVPAAKSAV
jgi:hypothetical protein